MDQALQAVVGRASAHLFYAPRHAGDDMCGSLSHHPVSFSLRLASRRARRLAKNGAV